jgi:leader peptidase (prepilin peptidase)/N-methyltransferase
MRYFVSFVAGLILGSFANVCIWRLPLEQSVVYPKSRCPHCKHAIRWCDNVPVISFVLLKGRCFYCRHPISWQYPLVELALGLLFVLAAWRFQVPWVHLVIVDVMLFYLWTISVIDFHHKIIPDELSLSLLGMGLLTSWFNPYLGTGLLHPSLESLLAALAGGGGMLCFAWLGEKVFKKEALGGGDIKLLAAFGACLGWGGLLGSLVIGSFLGAFAGGALLLLKRKKLGDTLPYGPFLCMGAFFSLFFPNALQQFLSP